MHNSTVADGKIQQFLAYGKGNDYLIFSAARNWRVQALVNTLAAKAKKRKSFQIFPLFAREIIWYLVY